MSLIDYLDKEKATKEILRDWNDQRWKFDFSKGKIEELESRLTSTITRLDKPMVSSSGADTEEKLAAVIDKKTVIEHGYKLASEYIRDLQPCWSRLTDEERYMLVCRFVDRDETRGVDAIMAKFYISKSEAYRRSNAALQRLAKLIFW
jgi:hypothetical protein